MTYKLKLSKDTIADFQYGWIMPYYPKRYSVPPDLMAYRQMLYNFKDGLTNYTELVQLIKPFLINEWEPKNKWFLTPIPTSNSLTTEKRFKEFVKASCSELGFENGYNLLLLKNYIEQRDLGPKPLWNVRVEDLIFNNVKGRNILLFDDVITKGVTFSNIGYELMKQGANKVQGLFLFKTLSPDQN